MKMTRKGFIFAVLIIGSLIIGGYIGQHTSNSLLSYTISMGFDHDSPLMLDLIFIKLSLGLTLNVSIAQVITLFTSIAVYVIFSKFID